MSSVILGNATDMQFLNSFERCYDRKSCSARECTKFSPRRPTTYFSLREINQIAHKYTKTRKLGDK